MQSGDPSEGEEKAAPRGGLIGGFRAAYLASRSFWIELPIFWNVSVSWATLSTS